MKSTQEQAVEYLEVLKEKEECALRTSELNKKIAVMDHELYDSMIEDQVDSIEIQGIKFEPKLNVNYSLQGKYKGKKWDEIEVWHDWLKEINEQGLIKTKESVNAKTREKFLKEYVEKGQELPDFIQEGSYGVTKFNKTAVKRLVNDKI